MPVEEYRSLAGELACARVTQLDEAELPPGLDEPEDQFVEVTKREALITAIESLPEKEG